VAASIGAHVLILAFLVMSARIESGYEPNRALEVRLVSPPHEENRPKQTEKAAPSHRKLAPNRTPISNTVAGSVAPPPAPTPAPPAPPSGLAAALRRSLGCGHADFVGLTSEERRRCRDQLAAYPNGVEERADFHLDPRKLAIFDAGAKRDRFLQEPFLAERPKKGCRPMVTVGDVPANGPAPQDVTVAIACGVQF
jgi:hypothetical protein